MAPPKLPKGLEWKKCDNSKTIPSNAIVGGCKVNGHPLYIGIVSHEMEYVPGPVSQGKNDAYSLAIPWGCTTQQYKSFFVLCANQNIVLQWMAESHGEVPNNAFPVDDAQDIFIGRRNYCGQLMVGKVSQSHRCLYIPYQKSEINFTDYEVLTVMRNF